MAPIETYIKAASLLRQISSNNQMDCTMLKQAKRYIDQRINYLQTLEKQKNDSTEPN